MKASTKLFGIHMEQFLNWSNHFQHLREKLNKKIFRRTDQEKSAARCGNMFWGANSKIHFFSNSKMGCLKFIWNLVEGRLDLREF